MFHQILYILHIFGMATIILIALFLLIKKNISSDLRKKYSLFLMSAAHTQLLTGFILFFLLLSQINHMKIGIKMLLAIEVAIVATIYRKKIANNESPNPSLLFVIVISAIIITIVAFAL